MRYIPLVQWIPTLAICSLHIPFLKSDPHRCSGCRKKTKHNISTSNLWEFLQVHQLTSELVYTLSPLGFMVMSELALEYLSGLVYCWDDLETKIKQRKKMGASIVLAQVGIVSHVNWAKLWLWPGYILLVKLIR